MSVVATANSLAREIATKTIYPNATPLIPLSLSFNEGDLLCYDSSAHLIKLPTAETDGATFLGVAPITVVNGKPKAAYVTDVDASVGQPAMPGPQYGSVYYVHLKAGDAVVPGSALYIDATGTVGRNVTSTGTKQIGIYQGPALTAPTGGQQVEMLVGARSPNDTLKF